MAGPYFNEYLGEWVGGNPTPTTVEQMYAGTPYQPAPAPTALETRSVQTYPVNGTNWANPAAPPTPMPSYIGTPHWAQYKSPSTPSNEVTVPPLPAFGNGPQMGYAPPAAHRLLPNPGLPSMARDNQAVAAIGNAAKPTYQSPARVAQYLPGAFSGPVHNLNPKQDPQAQAIANDLRIPVRTSKGQVVQPAGGTQLPSSRRPATQNVTAKVQPRGLLDFILGGKGGGLQRPGLMTLLMNGQAAMANRPPPLPRVPIPLTPMQARNQNPAALAALNSGSTTYVNNGGLLPTVAMNGQVRNSYGDSSSYGSGGSLV